MTHPFASPSLAVVTSLTLSTWLAACGGGGADGADSDIDGDVGRSDANVDGGDDTGNDADVDQDDDGGITRIRPLFSCTGDWVQMGSPTTLDSVLENPAMTSSLATDGMGHISAAWHELASSESYYDIFVRSWDGESWALVGDRSLDRIPASNSQGPSIALDREGRPVVTWHESCFIHVSRWDGSTWANVGGPLNEYPTDTHCGSLATVALDGQDQPIVTWNEHSSEPGVIASDVFVKRWDGVEWELMGDGALDRTLEDYSNFPVVRVDSSGRPVVKWNESDMQVTGSPSRHDTYVARWTDDSWELVGDGPVRITAGNHTYGDGFELDSLDNPVLAIEDFETETSHSVVTVMRWDGSDWGQVGDPVVADPEFGETFASSIVLDREDTPVVAFCETDGPTNRVRVMAFDGSQWIEVGSGPLNTGPDSSACPDSIVLDIDGHPVLTYTDWELDTLQNVVALRCE